MAWGWVLAVRSLLCGRDQIYPITLANVVGYWLGSVVAVGSFLGDRDQNVDTDSARGCSVR
jgi:hypothetical protein